MDTVLVVDDKEMLRDSVGATLQRAGFNVVTASDGESALEVIARRRPDAVVTDLRMPGMTGLALLEQAKQIDDALPIVLMTAFGAVDTAVEAMRRGAFDYITKPFEGDELVIAIKRAIDHSRLVRENAVLRTQGGSSRVGAIGGPEPAGLDRIIGDSPSMRRVKQQVMAVAESHQTVLVFGESGTGKEVIARAVHELSPRAGEAMLAINCAALSESLLESELFGHERGAFTGAERLRKGRFELADRGTLLLDEISEIAPRIQAKLLRVLQERSFERVGSSLTIGVDVRVVATSNRDLPKAVARGDFRQDLFFRLNVLPIHLPPLRDRLEDIPALVSHFAAKTAAREGKPAKHFSEQAMDVLTNYSWPGNVRELQNIVERAAVLARGESVERAMVEPWLAAQATATPPGTSSVLGQASSVNGSHASNGHAQHHGDLAGHFRRDVLLESKDILQLDAAVQVEGRQLEDIERDAIVRTLNKFNGHRQRTAQALGIGVRTLGLKLKKWKELQLVEATL
jgi:DNA-binding NtrC family response regulator